MTSTDYVIHTFGGIEYIYYYVSNEYVCLTPTEEIEVVNTPLLNTRCNSQPSVQSTSSTRHFDYTQTSKFIEYYQHISMTNSDFIQFPSKKNDHLKNLSPKNIHKYLKLTYPPIQKSYTGYSDLYDSPYY